MKEHGKKVLIIDDTEEIRDLVFVSLADSEFETIGAANGRDGFQTARDKKPDLILLDVMMPGFDGFETCKYLKINPDTKDIPVVFLTAKNTKSDIQKALSVGAIDYIIKPFSPSELLKRIKNHFSSLEIEQLRHTKQKKTSSEKTVQPVKNVFENDKIKYEENCAICSNIFDSIDISTYHIFRNVFESILSNGIHDIIIDMSEIEKLDATGLGLLISVDNGLKKRGGGLRLASLKSNLDKYYSYTKLKEMFQCYPGVIDAVNGGSLANEQQRRNLEKQVCLCCGAMNAAAARFCNFCGEIILDDDAGIYASFQRTAANKLLKENEEASLDEEELNSSEEYHDTDIMDKYIIEFKYNNIYCIVTCQQETIVEKDNTYVLSLKLPSIKDKYLPLYDGLEVRISRNFPGINNTAESKIVSVIQEEARFLLTVSKKAFELISTRFFTLPLNYPVPLLLTDPSFEYRGDIVKTKVLEICRRGLKINSKVDIPENKCLSLSLTLPDGPEINRPFVFAKKSNWDSVYYLRFVLMDSEERKQLNWYLYKLQIEMAKKEKAEKERRRESMKR